jgi:hypothetical protein
MIRDHSWREASEPHWLWLVGSLVAPTALLIVSLLGLGRGSFVSTGIAAAIAMIAVLVSLGFAGAALLRRSRKAIAITAAGTALTLLGYWWLHWVS